MRYYDECDIYDYLIAAGVGGVAGIIDALLVGSPQNSTLMSWTDKQVDNCVKSFAKLNGWSGNSEDVHSAIGFLEKKFPVNYDQRHSADVGGAFKMSAKNHHMNSLAHSPSPVGLVFSIIAQFTGKAAFVSNGKLVTVNTETMELQGGNFIAKLFCGAANWVGHLMSDIAGSSGATTRGSGIVAPFYELFQFMNFGKFNIGKDRQDLATLATRAFENGYDARFALTMAIPVVISDLLTRLIWSLRHYFGYKKPLKECIPTKEHDDLRIMLLVSNTILCLVDVGDAAIESCGNALTFFMNLNLVAWSSLVVRIIKEIVFRCRNEEENDINSDYYIDEESREIFLEASPSWKGVIKESVINSHIEGFWDCHIRFNDNKANRHMAFAIVLATSEGMDTSEMINLYFSNGGSAKLLGDWFAEGWYCSPNISIANKYYQGKYRYTNMRVART